MISRLRNWWGVPPTSLAPPPKNVPVPPPVSAVNISGAVAPKPAAPLAPKKVEPSGIELFLRATDVLSREKVLKEHPFWQTEHVEQQLNVPEVAAIIQHISDLQSKFAWRLAHAHIDYEDELRIESMRGMEWGKRDAYARWHQRAMTLIQAHPEDGDILLNAMQKHLEETSSSSDYLWIDEAEDLLRMGGSISTPDLLNGWLKRAQIQKFDGMAAVFEAYPLMTKAFQNVERDAQALEWVQENYKRALLLSTLHPRLDCWVLAEHIPKKELIVMLSEQSNDGALLKAWHGIALTGEETLQHPLAYSLYVHKHAPIYLEEARPLPDAWSMALSLSTTGVEFKEMLLSAAHLKMNPEAKPETWALPNLEV